MAYRCIACLDLSYTMPYLRLMATRPLETSRLWLGKDGSRPLVPAEHFAASIPTRKRCIRRGRQPTLLRRFSCSPSLAPVHDRVPTLLARAPRSCPTASSLIRRARWRPAAQPRQGLGAPAPVWHHEARARLPPALVTPVHRVASNHGGKSACHSLLWSIGFT